jgi:hypothetical protein
MKAAAEDVIENPWLFLLPFVGSSSNSLLLRRRGLRHLESASLSVGWSAAVEVAETCSLGITPIRRLCRCVFSVFYRGRGKSPTVHLQK